MAWPHPPDYNEAIQNPQFCFSDPELQQGHAAVNALGLPWPRSGNSADVYKVTCPHKQVWAVKCFTREVHGLQQRYQAISDHLQKRQLPFMVEFHYLDRGIRINGSWYPVLKMRWIEGRNLNELIKEYANRPLLLERLADMWVRLSLEMRTAQIGHGDLQHGNVLLVPGRTAKTLKLRLVDYDGLTVPALAQVPSDEVGHPNYQHPERLCLGNVNVDLDRFAHLVIYGALRCLVLGGRALWERYDNGENLLFREADFHAPSQSKLLHELWDTNHPLARTLVGCLLLASQGPLQRVPPLTDLVSNGQLRFLTVAEQRCAEALLQGTARAGKVTAIAPMPIKEARASELLTPDDPVAQLIATLASSEPRRREAAALTLGALGPEARAALPALREALNDADANVRTNAAQALWAIDPLP